ncbi:MAG: lysylphosphatidylglycerol synthase domain-containing protein [Bacteroidota bacterium]
MPYKTKQFFFVLIKLSIVVGAFYFIYSKIAENENLDFSVFIQFLQESDRFSAKNIIFLFILSIFNWFFEIAKWQELVRTVKNISFKAALEQSLGGLTASLITPNRIGDYGAKAIYFSKALRKRIVLLNLIGNMTQMTITTVIGCIGLIIFVNRYAIEVDYYEVGRFVLILAFIATFSAFGLKRQWFKIRGYSLEKLVDFIRNIQTRTLVLSVVYSLTRYIIFSFQFYVLLTLFGVDVDYFIAMVVISSMYLLASIVPSITIFDVVIKGSVAVFLFGYVDVNELTVLTIITIMWLLNFAIPSLFGSYYVLNFNLSKSDA